MVGDLILIILDGMRQGVTWLQSIELKEGVSVWSFVIACIVVGVVISGLLNLVNRPPIGDQVSDAKYRRRQQNRKKG